MPLSDQELRAVEARLTGEQRRIAAELQKLSGESDFGDDHDHLEEEADETEELTNQIPVRRSLETRVHRIERALERIRNGTYGYCTSCGKPISRELIEVDPESDLCQECKQAP